MRIAIAGAGPTGLYCAIALARRGHRVVVVDRDRGPGPDGTWERRGVMQFHHPHGLRRQIVEALEAEMPEVRQALIAAGAVDTVLPAEGDRPAMLVGMQCRRITFERVLRAAAVTEPGVEFRPGHADDVLREGGRATGLRVDGAAVAADLVLDASGRAGRIGDDLRAPEEGGDCGLSYVSRHYELRPGAGPGPVNQPLGLILELPGYLAGVFLQDNRTACTLIARLSDDRELAELRHTDLFDRAAAAIPGLAEWVDPDRSRALTDVLPGGRLRNTYRGQLDPSGAVGLPGLIHLGDAVCTTNPTAGRGITTSLLQARELLRLLDEHTGITDTTYAFDRYCTEAIRPWFDDHVRWDARQVREFAGEDVDLTRPLESGDIVATATADPSLMRVVGPYLSMLVLPAALAEIEPRAREIYASGWRRPAPEGPTRDDLADLIRPRAAATPGAVRG